VDFLPVAAFIGIGMLIWACVEVWRNDAAHLARRSTPKFTVLVAVFVGCFLLVFSCSRFAFAAEQKATEKPANGNTDRDVEKLIPDFKFLKGSPATVLDLADLVADREISAQDAVDFKVLFNKKKKVVVAEIRDKTHLVLQPGSTGKSEIIVEIRSDNEVPIHSKFQVRVWKPDYFSLILTVIGGLGIFLLGMKNMSDGLQAVAGNRLRKMIAAVTNNRLMATGVGTLVTMTLQSSSITTVMVVGFVNSGFMTLAQAVPVIFGANIGTTITGWILVLKIGVYGLPMAGLGAFGYLFLKSDRWRYSFMCLLGLGMVFLGLELMKDGFAIIKDLPAFEIWFEEFTAVNYIGVLKCAAVGCILTFIVQSSSATLGITIGLAQIGVIPFETAAALVLGENLGTTITAWLASFGTTTNAKRAAYAHITFNLIGVAWITAVFPWYMMLIRYFVGGSVTADMSTDVTAAIAATHTGFNVTNTILFLPFADVLAKGLIKLMPDREVDDPHLTNLDVRILESPVLAIEQSRVEVLKMAESCDKMMDWLRETILSETPNPNTVQQAIDEEETIDIMQDEVVAFMTRLLAANIPEELIAEARCQLRMADEYESVSDYVGRILKYQVKLDKAGLQYEKLERERMLKLHDMMHDYLKTVGQSYQHSQTELLEKATGQSALIAQTVRDMRNEMLEHMAQNKEIPPRLSVTYNRQIIAYRRVRDHAVNVAEAITGLK
jgi:phosphate:Na+ symporter